MYLSVVLYYLLAINLLTFVAYSHDKWKARHPHPHIHPRRTRQRTSEATLMLLAALGGSVGALLAMYLFRHKTLHKKFTLGIPLILVAQVVLAIVCAWLLTANDRAGRSGKTESAEVKIIQPYVEIKIDAIHNICEKHGFNLNYTAFINVFVLESVLNNTYTSDTQWKLQINQKERFSVHSIQDIGKIINRLIPMLDNAVNYINSNSCVESID